MGKKKKYGIDGTELGADFIDGARIASNNEEIIENNSETKEGVVTAKTRHLVINKPNLNNGKIMAFDPWFTNKLSTDKRLAGKDHRRDEIKIFFKGSGLKEFETVKVFDKYLETYFGN